ncbi:APC family permease [Neobacillus drentensis]|uniref:APC family permease n=1 Tax=Neobacillus drentensis TaxID=220684 RepID=UPI0028555B77|nr:APC family permease [Neobacillus drentensis]MDR7239201.1 amino acid transporter [Neobacillus drentensis]
MAGETKTNSNVNSIEEFGYKQELKRSLTFGDLFIYGVSLMVPIAPFGIYGYVAQASNGMVGLAYLIGMVGMIFTALSYARMSEAFPIAGSVYSYAQRGISDDVGFIAGWILLLDYIFVPTLIYLVAVAALQGILPEVPSIVWLVFFIGINTVLNVVGVKVTAKAIKLITYLVLFVLAIFVTVGIIAIVNGVNGAEFSFKPLFDPEHFSLGLVMGAVSIAVLSFLGFDAVSTLAEEAEGERKLIGKAIIFSLIAVGLLFIVQTWVAALIYPDYNGFDNLDTAFYVIAEIAGGPWLKWLTAISMAIAFGIADALVFQAAISRLLFSMARDKKLPSFLAKVHPKYKTPYTSTILVAILSFIVAMMFSAHLGTLTSLVNFGALTGFILLHLSVINYFIFRKKSSNYLNYLILPIIGLLIICYVWYSLESLAKIIGISWVVIGIVYMLIINAKNKKLPNEINKGHDSNM